MLMLAAGADSIVSAAAIARFAARLPAGSHRVIEGARHEILQEQDGYRAQLWAAFDAFVPGRRFRTGASRQQSLLRPGDASMVS